MKSLNFDAISQITFFDKLGEFANLSFNKTKNIDPTNDLLETLETLNKLDVLEIVQENEYAEDFHDTVFCTWVNKDNNNLYKFINNLSITELKEILTEIKISKTNIEKIKNKLYNCAVLSLLFDYTSCIDTIKLKYSFNSLTDLTDNSYVILNHPEFRLIAPLILYHEEWKKLVTKEISKLKSISHMKILINKISDSLDYLKINYYFDYAPLIFIERHENIFCEWYEKKNFFVYPIYSSICYKKEFLQSLNDKYLNKIYEKNINFRYRRAKIELANIENELSSYKFKLKSEKSYTDILNGLKYLLHKQNPDKSNRDILSTSKVIMSNLFHSNKIKLTRLKLTLHLK
jgi:hypothetical protein